MMERDVSFLKSSLIAHRGYHDLKKGIPENSMAAFKRAVYNNLIIELDVHILKDGNVVVFHDDNLRRMTGLNKNIKDMTYDEIKKVRLKGTKEKIPLFKDVLSFVDGEVPLIIELKYDVKCGVLESEVIRLLKSYKGKYAVKSFSPFSVNYFRKHFPSAIRGQLASDFKNSKISRFEKWFLSHMIYNFISKPDFISYDIRALPNKKVTKFRKNKLVLGWTVRSKTSLNNSKKYCDNCICEKINLNEK